MNAETLKTAQSWWSGHATYCGHDAKGIDQATTAHALATAVMAVKWESGAMGAKRAEREQIDRLKARAFAQAVNEGKSWVAPNTHWIY
jgi:hypothetical protein